MSNSRIPDDVAGFERIAAVRWGLILLQPLSKENDAEPPPFFRCSVSNDHFSMNEFITWGSLFKLAITGVLIYAVQPLLLVGRDAVLWWAIDKYILNEELRNAVFELVSHEKMLAKQPKNIDIFTDREGESYVHDGIAVSPEQHASLMKKIHVCDQTLARIRPLVEARKRRLEWLLHHYKQPGKGNLIEDMISQHRAAQEAGKTITLQIGP